MVDWSSERFVEQFRQGDRHVLDSIYRRYVADVDRALRRGFVTPKGHAILGVVDRQSRFDLLQEVFLRAFSPAARKSYDPRKNYGSYLHGITRNVIGDEKRRVRRASRIYQSVQFETTASRAPAAVGLRQPDIFLVEQYLASVAPPLDVVYELRFVAGKTQSDAAHDLGVTRQSLRTLERHLKDGLKRKLKL